PVTASPACTLSVLFLMPRPAPRSTLFPYTTLFRSRLRRQNVGYSNFSQPQSHLSFCVLLQYLVERRRVVTQLGKNAKREMRLRRSEERFSRNAETELVCRLLLEKKNEALSHGCPSR